MIIRESDILSTNEMKKFFNVSDSKWKRNKNKLLKHFGNYFEYEVLYQGRNINYHIIKEIKPYQEPTKERKSEKRDRDYEKNIIKVIEKDDIQTAMNVSRIIKDYEDIKAYNHKETTIYEYTRVQMRNMFGTEVNQGGTRGIIERKIWCKLLIEENRYEELNEEEIQDFYNIFKKTKDEIKENELEIFSDFQNGLITKEEMNEQIGYCGYECFLTARKIFKSKYGFYPIKVPQYVISAFERTEENEFNF